MQIWLFIMYTLAVSTAGIKVTADSLIDDSFRMLRWGACNVTKDNLYARATSGFRRIYALEDGMENEKLSLQNLLANKNAPESSSTLDGYCIKQGPPLPNVTQCGAFAEAMVDTTMCLLLRNLRYPPLPASVNCSLVQCADGEEGRRKLCAAIDIMKGSPRDVVVFPECRPTSILLRGTQGLAFGQRKMLNSFTPSCSDELEFQCSRCVPYIHSMATAQPYAFLMFNAIRGNLIEVILLLVQAAILRKKMKRNDPIDPEDTIAATEYVPTCFDKVLDWIFAHLIYLQVVMVYLSVVYSLIFFALCINEALSGELNGVDSEG